MSNGGVLSILEANSGSTGQTLTSPQMGCVFCPLPTFLIHIYERPITKTNNFLPWFCLLIFQAINLISKIPNPKSKPSAICHPSSVFCHLSSVLCRLSTVIRHPSFALSHPPTAKGLFPPAPISMFSTPHWWPARLRISPFEI